MLMNLAMSRAPIFGLGQQFQSTNRSDTGLSSVLRGKELKKSISCNMKSLLFFFCFCCGLLGHSDLECPNPVDRDEFGLFPYNKSLRAPQEKKKKIQSFGQAAAASWHSNSLARSTPSRRFDSRSTADESSQKSSGSKSIDKGEEADVNAQVDKAFGIPECSKVSENTRKLSPTSSVVGALRYLYQM